MGKNINKVTPPKKPSKIVAPEKSSPAKTTVDQNQRGKTKSKGSSDLTR